MSFLLRKITEINLLPNYKGYLILFNFCSNNSKFEIFSVSILKQVTLTIFLVVTIYFA